MSAAAETGFTDRSMLTPCCGVDICLEHLDYGWDVAFGRFVIDVMNAGRGPLTEGEVARLSDILGAEARVVYQHL